LHRCLQRHGISRLPDVDDDKRAKRKFRTYPIGYFHIDIAEMQTAEGKLYLYVAIDRTSKITFVQVVRKAGRTSAAALTAIGARRRAGVQPKPCGRLVAAAWSSATAVPGPADRRYPSAPGPCPARTP
jgi:hypothetical protein